MKAGLLIYDAVIDEQGRVGHLRLLRPVDPESPWPEIDKAWRSAIEAWRYEPTLVGGKPVRVCMTITAWLEVR